MNNFRLIITRSPNLFQYIITRLPHQTDLPSLKIKLHLGSLIFRRHNINISLKFIHDFLANQQPKPRPLRIYPWDLLALVKAGKHFSETLL